MNAILIRSQEIYKIDSNANKICDEVLEKSGHKTEIIHHKCVKCTYINDDHLNIICDILEKYKIKYLFPYISQNRIPTKSVLTIIKEFWLK